MLSQIEHYTTFYGLVMACSLLSNDGSEAYEHDAGRIIDFYCRARDIDQAIIDEWKECIFEVLADVSVMDERAAIYSRRSVSREYKDVDLLYDVKSDVIGEISAKYSGVMAPNTMFVNPAWFDYSHVIVYHPTIRYKQILSAASSGWRVAARQVGIMRALGVGCAVDLESAKRKFLQCTYWCDVPSCVMLAYLCRATGDQAGARLYGDLFALLHNYLKDGVTVIPADVRGRYDPAAVVKYAQIASIYRDVCCAGNRADIDYSFVEVMMSEDISDSQKMAYINTYDRKTWTEAINPSYEGVKPIGFKGGAHGE